MQNNKSSTEDLRWLKWAGCESLTRATSAVFQKCVGVFASTISQVFWAAGIVGLVQITVGSLVAKRKKIKFIPSKENLIGSIIFGLFALASTILGFLTFAYGGDLGVRTFILTLGIFPGAIMDTVLFGHRIARRQWFSIMLAVLAGYLILGSPFMGQAIGFPIWVILALINMMTVATNQAITQRIKTIDPAIKNIWGGGVAIVGSLVAVWIIGGTELPSAKLILVSVIVGCIAFLLWVVNLLSYKGGAFIALKKLVTNGGYLILAMIAGAIFFGEVFSLGKVLGCILYLSAFCLWDTNTWQFVKKLGPR